MKARKLAAIFLRKDLFFLHSYARTTAGVWISTDPCLRLEASCTDAELGTAARTVLAASRIGVPHPTSWEGLSDPILKLSGLRSWPTFARSAKYLSIEENDDDIVLTPSKPTADPGVDGFSPDLDHAVILAISPDVTTIGGHVRQMMTRMQA